MKKDNLNTPLIPRLPLEAVEKLKRAQKIKSKKDYNRKRDKQKIENE